MTSSEIPDSDPALGNYGPDFAVSQPAPDLNNVPQPQEPEHPYGDFPMKWIPGPNGTRRAVRDFDAAMREIVGSFDFPRPLYGGASFRGFTTVESCLVPGFERRKGYWRTPNSVQGHEEQLVRWIGGWLQLVRAERAERAQKEAEGQE